MTPTVFDPYPANLAALPRSEALADLRQARVEGLQAQKAWMQPRLDRLVAWQAQGLASVGGADTEAEPDHATATRATWVQQGLDDFVQFGVPGCFGRTWAAAEHQAWAALQAPLRAAFEGVPQTVLQGDWGWLLAQGHAPDGCLLPQGPASYDWVSLLRDPWQDGDEEWELDWAVRYWEAARRAGLPWDADFHACWQAMEFQGLQRHLMLLGRCGRWQQARPGSVPEALPPRLLAHATRVATRYRALAPLLPLLDALRPGLTSEGFTLR